MTLPIPAAALTQHVIALGKTGSGKSSKLRVLVEHELQADRPVTIVDRKGDWWGLKSSADGKASGFPIVIFGGEHADVPINPHSGAHVAELVATGNRSSLIDLGGWMVGECTRFWIDFAGAYFRQARGARTLVLPEVHNFAPQGKVLDVDAGKALHWANRLASEGRAKGITIMADSQRPQKCHKDFLTSCETLIACRVIHKLDRDAIKDWIDGCADRDAGRQVLETLAQMKRTDAWCWSPEIEFGPKLITWPMFKTFDSFKPQPERAVKFTGWASVDLDEVKAKLAIVVEEAKSRDPRELMRKIDALNKEVISLRKDQPPIYDGVAIEAAEERGFTRGLAYGQNLANNIRVALLAMVDANDKVVAGMESMLSQINGDDPGAKFVYEGAPKPKPAAADSHARSMRSPTTPRAASASGNGTGNVGGGSLSGAERKVLTALAQHREGCEIGKIALLAGYAYTGGGFRNTLGALRQRGLLEGENTGVMHITEAGLAYGPFQQLPRGQALREHWLNHSAFGKAAREALAALLDNPRGLTLEQIAELTGKEPTGGGFRNSLGELRTAGVLVGKNTGVMTASEELLA